MRKETKKQIIRWHEAGVSVDEFAPIIPQYSREEIEAVLEEYRRYKDGHF